MPSLFRCPQCGQESALSAAGLELHQPLVQPSMTSAQVRQRIEAGRARARKAGRTERGMFTSYADDAERDREWFEWLCEKSGRAGGVERALSAERDEFGRFARSKS
jgi:hypothetical protein